MFRIARSSTILVRPLIRKPNTIKIVVKQPIRNSSTQTSRDFFPFGAYTSLIKPALFTAGVIGGSFFVAEYAARKKYVWRDITDGIKKALNTQAWVPPNKGVAMALIAANVCVFAAMHIPAASHYFSRFFTHSINNRRVSTFVLSCFGHGGFVHILLNMYMLYTFLPPIQRALGPERSLALYFSAGAFSSLASHVNMLAQRSLVPSLGASGAICGLFAAFCMLYPHTNLQLILLPGVSLEARQMIWVPIVIESILLVALRGRARIDFAAHLGGFAFGAAYIWYLQQSLSNRVRHRQF